MIKFFKWLIFGGCDHKWETTQIIDVYQDRIDRQYNESSDSYDLIITKANVETDLPIGKRAFCVCEKCGAHKKFEMTN